MPKGFNGPTLVVFDCPSCGKNRLQRPKGHEVSFEQKEITLPSGLIIKHYTDVCQICLQKLVKKMMDKPKKQTKKLLEALEKGTKLDCPLEDLL